MTEAEKIKLIGDTRDKIIQAQETTDKLYAELVNSLGIESMSTEDCHLFDLIFNTPAQEDYKAGVGYWLDLCEAIKK